MNAIQFIKEHGVDKAREVVSAYHGIPSYTFKEKTGRGYSACESVDLDDLKRIIESVDLVDEYGGVSGTRDFISGYTEEQLAKPIYSAMLRLKQAIKDYEAIYSIPESVRQAILNLEMHL